MKLDSKSISDVKFEKIEWREFGPGLIIGVDEVGRGCLAGPVFAAAVAFDPNLESNKLLELSLTDSKLINEKKRKFLSEQICTRFIFGIGTASVAEIDEINILQASFLAMGRAIKLLMRELKERQTAERTMAGKKPVEIIKGNQVWFESLKSGTHLLIDGPYPIPKARLNLEDDLAQPILQVPIIKGDLRVSLISAASIVAKVARDEYMKKLAIEYPGYKLEQHKGYSTLLHKQAIQKLGPADIHRRSFNLS